MLMEGGGATVTSCCEEERARRDGRAAAPSESWASRLFASCVCATGTPDAPWMSDACLQRLQQQHMKYVRRIHHLITPPSPPPQRNAEQPAPSQTTAQLYLSGVANGGCEECFLLDVGAQRHCGELCEAVVDVLQRGTPEEDGHGGWQLEHIHLMSGDMSATPPTKAADGATAAAATSDVLTPINVPGASPHVLASLSGRMPVSTHDDDAAQKLSPRCAADALLRILTVLRARRLVATSVWMRVIRDEAAAKEGDLLTLRLGVRRRHASGADECAYEGKRPKNSKRGRQAKGGLCTSGVELSWPKADREGLLDGELAQALVRGV